MFGLNEITWAEFLRLILFSLLLWYILLITMAWIKTRGKNKKENFEDYNSEGAPFESLQAIAVSSKDFPAEIIKVNPVENEPLQASLYEETGYDEGLGIEYFGDRNSPMLALMLPDIQYQQ